jgi:NAD(P)-dependent dehydrogenase (short-subunit alcohol dehydrogenase family)
MGEKDREEIAVKSILITGANRGIGFELTRAFARLDGTTVFAACRNPDNAVELRRFADENPGVEIAKLDVEDQDSIGLCAKEIAEKSDTLFALINNAGIFGGSVAAPLPETSKFGSLEMEEMLRIFRVNTVAPVLMAQAFAGLLGNADSPRIVNVSSDAGSIGLRDGGCSYSYPASKAALNMMTRCLAAELKDKGIIVVSVHPGFLRTDMGGPNAPLSLDDTIPHLVTLIEGLTVDNSGAFLNWDGARIPW